MGDFIKSNLPELNNRTRKLDNILPNRYRVCLSSYDTIKGFETLVATIDLYSTENYNCHTDWNLLIFATCWTNADNPSPAKSISRSEINWLADQLNI